MKERPILFSAPMVRALLDGSKTQTRRAMKVQPPKNEDFDGSDFGVCRAIHPDRKMYSLNQYEGLPKHPTDWDLVGSVGVARIAGFPMVYRCPYGQPDDWLWVRENFCPIYPQDLAYNGGRPIEYDYAASYEHGDRLGDRLGIKKTWKPSIHMPRVASRISLEVTSVRVERLQDISEGDAEAEGVRHSLHLPGGRFARENFAHLWWTINGDGSWEANPWVWVIEFKKVDQ